jgi:hypothetical protein
MIEILGATLISIGVGLCFGLGAGLISAGVLIVTGSFLATAATERGAE